MKERKLAILSTLKIENKILIFISAKWCNKFQTENPTFEAIVDQEGRYTLRGPKVYSKPRSADPTSEQEDLVNE